MTKINFLVFCFLLINATHSLSQVVYNFNVGAAQSVITPTDTAFIAGHTHNRIFKGVNDEIFVKSIVISNQKNTIAILTFDCIGLLYPQLVEIRKIVKKSIPEFPVENIVMSSTHTHSGPDVVGIWGKDIMHSGVDKVYMNNLVMKAAHTLTAAWANRRLAKGEYGTSFYGEEWVYNISEPAELDRSVTVMRFRDPFNYNIATLTNFACHPTFLDAVNDKVSSDYVGGYYQKMGERQGGCNLFLQGSIGGWVQPEYEDKTSEQAFLRGEQLAEKVFSVLENPKPLLGKDLNFQSKVFQIPVENSGFIQLSENGIILRDLTDSVLTEVAYFEIGNASFATHPGETVPALSITTKEMMKNSGPRFILGLGMDALGYILKPYFFDQERSIPHSQYLCSVSLGVHTERYILNVLKDLIQYQK